MLIYSMCTASLPCLSGGCLSVEMFVCVSKASRSRFAVLTPFDCFPGTSCYMEQVSCVHAQKKYVC